MGTQQDHGKASDTSSGYLKKCTDKVMAGKYTSGQQNPGVRKTTKKGASRKKAVGKKARAKNSGETGKIDDPNVMEVDKPFEMNDGDITMRSANSNDAQKVTQDAQSDNDATEEADQTKQFHFGSDEDM